MKKYKVAIEEIETDIFDVEANNAKEAIEIAINKYKSGEFTLKGIELLEKRMSIVEPDNEKSKWFEF